MAAIEGAVLILFTLFVSLCGVHVHGALGNQEQEGDSCRLVRSELRDKRAVCHIKS